MSRILYAGAVAVAVAASTALAAAQTPGGALNPPGGTLDRPPPATILQPGPVNPTAKVQLSDAQKVAILMAIKQDGAKITPPPSFSASVGAPVPPSIELHILPREALAQAPEANALKYTVVQNDIVLVDPTTMRVVDVIQQ